nr:hypothetical protein [Tanacetum cinerariifolium]
MLYADALIVTGFNVSSRHKPVPVSQAETSLFITRTRFSIDFPAIVYNDALTSEPKISSDFENEFPPIVYNDALATDRMISSEPSVSPLDNNEINFKKSFDESEAEDYTVIYDKKSFSYKIISINDLKIDLKNDNDEVDIPSIDVVVEHLDNGINDNVDANSHEFDEIFEMNHDIHRAASEWLKKDYISSVTTWEDLVEKFVQKFYQLSDNNEEMEADKDDDPNDIATIFKIEGNLFDFKTPLCKAFNEFNYLLKINTDLFNFDIQGIKTYEEYKLNNNMTGDLDEPWSDNRVLYQLCDHICEPYHLKNGKTKWPTCSSDIDGFFNGRELPGMVRVRNYRANNAGNTQENKKGHHDLSINNIKRLEMMKYSFDVDDK